MPFTFPSPNNFQITSKWHQSYHYSQWVKGPNGLEQYLENTPAHPPYVIGSTTISTTDSNNYVNLHNFNTLNGAGLKARMASAFPKPSNPDIGDVPLSTYKTATEGLSNVTIKKTLFNQPGIWKLGSNTYVGNVPNKKLSDLGYNMLQYQTISKSSNISGADALKRTAAILALGAASGFTSSPRLVQLGTSAANTAIGETSFYSTTPFENLSLSGALQFAPFTDFRARRGYKLDDLIGKRLDGTAAQVRNIVLLGGKGVKTSGAYAAASISPTGAYSIFNLDAVYGWGDHGTKFALRNDFTSRSHVASIWSKTMDGGKGGWDKPGFLDDPIAKVTPFRGDKVSVIDFKKSTLADAYRWSPGKPLTDIAAKLAKSGISGAITKDFIKFFFTGPKLVPWADKDVTDDIMVFRAIITNLTDSFNPQWTPTQFIGRADPNYNYTSYDRQLNLDFTVYATDKDELKPIWRKLNALATYTAPEYDGSTIGLKGPYMRVTVGDLFYQQPIIITSLYYTLQDPETTWETNIEDDPANMEVPMKIQVSLGCTVITDYLPQKGGRMYTLADKGKIQSENPAKGDDNWLSDVKDNPIIEKDNR